MPEELGEEWRFLLEDAVAVFYGPLGAVWRIEMAADGPVQLGKEDAGLKIVICLPFANVHVHQPDKPEFVVIADQAAEDAMYSTFQEQSLKENVQVVVDEQKQNAVVAQQNNCITMQLKGVQYAIFEQQPCSLAYVGSDLYVNNGQLPVTLVAPEEVLQKIYY